MISQVFEIAFPEVASELVIRGRDHSWEYYGSGSTRGKQKYIASAAEELSLRHAETITKSTTLLIDDDADNFQIAATDGTRAVFCDIYEPEKMRDDMMALI